MFNHETSGRGRKRHAGVPLTITALRLMPAFLALALALASAPIRAASPPPSPGHLDAARELIAWWKRRGRDPRDKLMVLSDAMDIDSIENAVRALRGQINVSIGWGTNLTNDFSGCAPAGVDGELRSISLVCKVVSADGRPAVKLSDNPNKELGPPEEIARYRRVFGVQGMAARPVTV